MDNYEREYGWDDVIEKDSEFILVPEGDYEFTIKSFTRERFNGSPKMPACNKAVVDVAIMHEGKELIIKHSLLMHSKCEWSLSEFFAGIGQKKKGEPLRMNWSLVPGSTGKCKIGIKMYNGNQYNEIKKFYPKDPSYYQDSNAAPQSQQMGGGFTAGRF